LGQEFVSLTPLGFIITGLMCALMIFSSRPVAVLSLVMSAIYITQAQQLELLGLHFTSARIVILAGWIRLIIGGEFGRLKLNTIDKFLILFIAYMSAVNIIFRGTLEDLTYSLGVFYDTVGSYFVVRMLIHNLADAEETIRKLSFAIIPLALFMIVEAVTGRNIFSILGGVGELSVVREGSIRAQGPFRHPILSGTFGGTLLPLVFGLWFQRGRHRFRAVAGIVGCTAITFTSASSGPILSYLAGIIGLLFWPLRRHMRLIRWSLLVITILLHLVMKDSVWFLIARVGEKLGGAGHAWYRSAVIDKAISHLNEWWLVGAGTTAHWGLVILPNYPTKCDITNHYVGIGLTGGVLSIILFVVVIVYCFRNIGKAITEGNLGAEAFVFWGMGCALLSHTVSFLGVSYFDQTLVTWYFLIGLISSTTCNVIGLWPSRNRVKEQDT
jgi:hypothetical protein